MDKPALEFPEEAIRRGARDMRLGCDCAVSVISYEASVREFVTALLQLGWTLSPPPESAIG